MVDNLDFDSNVTLDRERLYQLWEKGHWSAKAIDLTQDYIGWREKLNDEQRLAILVVTAMFLDGEQAVVADLTPFLSATSRPEDRVFLATQIADEGQHHVFFDRFLREVVGIGHDMVSTHKQIHPYLNASHKLLFRELDHATDQLRRRPHDAPLLTEALIRYYLIGEGIAHMGQHFLYIFGAETNLLPGFIQGINFIARDESRHIAFGLLWLQDLVTSDSKCRIRAIQTLTRVLPLIAGMLFLPNFVHSLGISNREACIFILRTLGTRLRRIGISPAETQLAVLGHTNSPEQQADYILTLMESGVFTNDEALQITKEAMEVIFDGVYNVAVWMQEKHGGFYATIQWIFDEAEPRYLEISRASSVRTGVGIIANPHLTLYVTAADWACIMLGKLHPLHAFFTRRLRFRGDWRILLRLFLIRPA